MYPQYKQMCICLNGVWYSHSLNKQSGAYGVLNGEDEYVEHQLFETFV